MGQVICNKVWHGKRIWLNLPLWLKVVEVAEGCRGWTDGAKSRRTSQTSPMGGQPRQAGSTRALNAVKRRTRSRSRISPSSIAAISTPYWFMSSSSIGQSSALPATAPRRDVRHGPCHVTHTISAASPPPSPATIDTLAGFFDIRVCVHATSPRRRRWSIYKISGSGSRGVPLMVSESHFCPSKSATQFPECDWFPDGFDGNKIGARCADVSATSKQDGPPLCCGIQKSEMISQEYY
ncbi:hypothetical protein K438DRAFT_2114711 [Mycena galopus ATCC 62051]|nr:hypothetical protein K438DRAFT_2114711 [Mycena galopus ATCC 62051]